MGAIDLSPESAFAPTGRSYGKPIGGKKNLDTAAGFLATRRFGAGLA
jgi:hypothetical protein